MNQGSRGLLARVLAVVHDVPGSIRAHLTDGDIAFGRQSNRPPRRITEKSLAESFPAEC